MPGTNRPIGNIVRHHHADRRLDLLRRTAQRRRIRCCRRDRSVVDVVDRVFPQREDLGEPATDLVDEQHGAERGVAVEPGLSGRGDGDGVIVVVAEFARRPSLRGVVSEVGAVGIPLADGRCIGGDSSFHKAPARRSETDATPAACHRGRGEGLATEHRRRVGRE